MPQPNGSALSRIKTFDSLLAYLAEELHWPVEDMEIEEIGDAFFDYDPERDFQLDPKVAAKIRSIKQLRPLKDNQPFGIFFIEFEPKRLPVTALRRILGKLVTKKRSSANPADRQTWNKDDLIFASAYGEDDTRRIDFAHFADDADNRLATLRVLGWDEDDTERKLDLVERQLKEKLAWPERETAKEWRLRWREAFIFRHREAVTTSRDLVKHLAELAQKIRARVLKTMAVESDKGAMRKLHKAFQESLIHDLNDERFADMYAQTIAYGLLSAAVSRTSPDAPGTPVVVDDAADLVIPQTSPFLKELMEEFIRIGGRDKKAANGKGIDFDELGVNDVAELLRHANMKAVIADFGRERPGEDPVIHFYEYFMEVYDKKEKVKRGVFYTPRPVVSFIVRSVDEILREEFGLPLGLADTTTWGEMLQQNRARKEADRASPTSTDAPFTIPPGVNPTDPFVQILDPATGTGTFLVETIDLIHRRMVEHWQGQKKTKAQIEELWNEYVPEHLLPRLYGFELMMAPYAIAHMKIGLKLGDTGYRFQSEQRLRVFLTNSLEPPTDLSEMLEFVAPFLAHEARAANTVKGSIRPTTIIGNPPYSADSQNPSQTDTGELTFAGQLIRDYFAVNGRPLGERNPRWLQDDYVKFIRLGEHYLSMVPRSVLGFITNHGFLGNPTFRGMRWHLCTTFRSIAVYDLHGNSKRLEVSPDGSADENVFDIQQGVAITLATRTEKSSTEVRHADLWGVREHKYQVLNSTGWSSTRWEAVDPRDPLYVYGPEDSEARDEFAAGISIDQLFSSQSVGIVTGRDALTVHFTELELLQTAHDFLAAEPEKARERFGLGKDSRDWGVERAQADLRQESDLRSRVVRILYRPFDWRYTLYTARTSGFHCMPRRENMRHLLAGQNVALISARSNKFPDANHFFCSRVVVEAKCGEASTQCAVFPVERLEDGLHARGAVKWIPNLDDALTRTIVHLLGEPSASRGSDHIRLFHYAYALFHSPAYRQRYGEFLQRQYPAVLLPKSAFGLQLVDLGADLVALHLLEPTYAFASWVRAAGASSPLSTPYITFSTHPNREVRRVGEKGKTMAPSPKGPGFGRVYINDTAYFDGIPEAVWKFHIGGYQVCHKWLADRKGRTLSGDDIAHYHKIVIALNETIRIMSEIDAVIEEHGGWPGAFVTTSQDAT